MNCPICGSQKFTYRFTIRNLRIIKCEGCNLLVSSGSGENHKRSDDYSKPDQILSQAVNGDEEIEKIAINSYLNELCKKGICEGEAVFIAAPKKHPIIDEASRRGYHVFCMNQLDSCFKKVDAALIFFELEKAENPAILLNKIHEILKPDGLLIVITPSLDSPSARFFKNQWTEWRDENRFYYSNISVQLQLWNCGYEHICVNKDRRRYSLDHIYCRAKDFPSSLLTKLIVASYPLFPHLLRKVKFRLPTSSVVIIAKKREISEPKLSVILPVYNENKTFSVLMEELLKKNVLGIEKEIIIVESNSKDGSRESVLAYQEHPGVTIVLQDSPHGKGNAVREGLKHAKGDVILIQDADLEYDINDYDALVEPIINHRMPFVLGSRHGGNWKMRQFIDQKEVSTIMNLGQVFFTQLLNILYGQKMKDPFTMYKVFNRDCLYRLKFECNRFDFDFELVIKLIRKGYIPYESPVNYKSRSFNDGKKVQVFRDPFTWLLASFKYRFSSIWDEEVR